MNTRERWLVGMMVVSVAYGGYVYIARAVRSPDDESQREQAITEVEAFAKQTRARLAQLKLTREEQAILNRTVAEWAPSPFLQERDKAQPVAEQATVFHYTGYLHVGAVKLAIINGREYRVADTVGAGDFVVESIDARQVVLAAKGGGRRLSIAMTDSEQTGERP